MATEILRIETGLQCAKMAIEALIELEQDQSGCPLTAKGLEASLKLLTTDKLGYRFFKVLNALHDLKVKYRCKGTPIRHANGKKLRVNQTKEYWLGQVKGIDKAIAILVEC